MLRFDPTTEMTLDLLRHGELQGGVKYRGRTDDPLTSEGRKAMDRVWRRLAEDVDAIIASPLRRCAEPATAWAAEIGMDCILEPRLAEMDYGAWEGKTVEEITRAYPGVLERWRADPTGMRPPGGESPASLRLRLADWWAEAQQQFSGSHILIVAHSGSLRMLIALLLNQPVAYTRQIDMPYACRKRFTIRQGEASECAACQ